MKLTPPTNRTFYASGALGAAGLLLGSMWLALAGLVLLGLGNYLEKL
tara:strand:+ start:1677 stop:1817 length:141 start_codon:yes stop_codon:yes gene_type:complete